MHVKYAAIEVAQRQASENLVKEMDKILNSLAKKSLRSAPAPRRKSAKKK